MATYKMFINGRWTNSSSGQFDTITNPANQKPLARVPRGNIQDLNKAVQAARKSFDSGVWSDMTPSERSEILHHLADLLEKNLQKFAKLESLNVGKSIKYTTYSDFPFTIDNIRFFAGACRTMTGIPAGEYADFHAKREHKGLGTSLLRREPIGVVGCIMPWNYPVYVAVWQAIPALAAGNSVVLKPASLTPLTTLEFAKLTKKVGIPAGVFNVVTGPGHILGAELAKHPGVDMICLTGSTDTGKEIMKLASSNLKKVHLELGGKAPLIVFEDANLEAAVEGAVVGSFLNVGQDCTAATRIYVHEKIHNKFVRLLIKKVKKIKFGNPLAKSTDLGPLASKAQYEKTLQYIALGKKQGAKLIYGGRKPKGKQFEKGFYLLPAIFTDVKQNMRICQDEIFGPVLSILRFKTEKEVVHKANDAIYGLAASVWTSNISRALGVSKKLKFGEVWVNDHGILVSELPHGGFKQSGFGRDLSVYALEEYTQLKHVYVDITGKKRKPWYFVVYGKP